MGFEGVGIRKFRRVIVYVHIVIRTFFNFQSNAHSLRSFAPRVNTSNSSNPHNTSNS